MTFLSSAGQYLATWVAAYNDMVAQRDTWYQNFLNMQASRDYWQVTVAHNDPNVWDNRYNAGYSAGANAVYGGLNNPDGESIVVQTYGMGENGSTPAVYMTIPRNGHFVIGGYADGSGGLISHGTQVTISIRGIINADKQTQGNNNNGTITYHGGWVQHRECAQGEQFYIQASNSWLPSSSTTIVVYAHFIPNATYHN